MFLTGKSSWTGFDRVAFAYSRNTMTAVDTNIKSQIITCNLNALEQKRLCQRDQYKTSKRIPSARNKIHQGDREDIQSSAKQRKHACTVSGWITK